MHDSKVVSQIAAMDARERERLRQFVHSPYFNRHRATMALLDYILAQLKKAKPKLDDERVEKAVADQGTDQSLTNLQTSLMKLLNQFLAVEQFLDEPFSEEIRTVKRTEKNQRVKLLTNRGKRLERKIKNYPYRDRELHLAAYEWKSISAYQQTQSKRKHTPDFQQMLDHLDRFYLVEKLRHFCHLTANMMLMNTSYDFLLLEPILEYLGGATGEALREEEQSIDCYYHILMSLRKPEESVHYDRIRYYLDEGISRIAEEERRDIFVFASNYCIKRVMSGDADYYRQLFELYQRSLLTGTIFDKGEISEYDYKNIVTIGVGVKEFAWTEDFIERYQDRLPPKKRENAYALNKAQFLYTTGRLDEAASQLVTVADSEVIYHQARVMLQVRIAYDQQETDYGLNLLETFRLFVRRNRNISTKDKRSYTNFVRFTKQLVTLKHQEDYLDRKTYAKRMSGLNEKVGQTPLLIGRRWLLEESRPPANPTE